MLPACTSDDDSALSWASRCRSRRGPGRRPGPLATASRQPTLPQRHCTVGAVRRGDVAEVAGGAEGPAVQAPVADHAGADAGRDLDEEQVIDVGRGPACSPSAIRLTSLSTRTGTSKTRADVGHHVVAVPSRHDRRVARPAGRVLDGTGQADADTGEVARRAAGDPRAAATRPGDDQSRSTSGPSAMSSGLRSLVQRCPPRSVTASRRVRRAEVGGDRRRGPGG